MQTSFGFRALHLLRRRWMWILAAAAMAPAIVAVVVLSQPTSYSSSVSIVPRRARTEVDYDTRIRTVSSDGGQVGQGPVALASASAERRQALAQLVRSAEIERAVQEQLGSELPDRLRSPGRLLHTVQGKVVPRSEVITIEVSAPSAVLAERIASIWSRVYEQRVNELYGSSVSGALQLDKELTEARQKYQVSEGALTAFLTNTPLGEFSRLLESRERSLRELLVLQQSYVIDLYKVSQRIDLFIGQAEAMQQQLALASPQDAGAAASNATALVLLKTQAFASSMSLPSTLQLQLPVASSSGSSGAAPSTSTGPSTAAPEESRADAVAVARSLQDWSLPAGLQIQIAPSTSVASVTQQRADVAATLQSLRQWKEQLESDIKSREAAAGGDATTVNADVAGITAAISRLEAETRELQGRVADHAARQRNLQQERDVFWESYTSLLKKAEEARVASVVGAGKEVSVAGQSVAEPRPRHLWLLLPMAAAIGAVAVAGWLILNEAAAAAAMPSHRTANGYADSAARSHASDASAEPVARA